MKSYLEVYVHKSEMLPQGSTPNALVIWNLDILWTFGAPHAVI